jgi:hypothetical protein
MPSVGFDLEAQRRLLAELEALMPPPDQDLGGPWYGGDDARVLFGMVRHLKPRRIVELGSGSSSRVIQAAADANRAEGNELSHAIFDPFPESVPVPTSAKVERLGATAVPAEQFERLEASDVLFVDTTHTVKTGGDVNHIVLNILPRLRPGVVVHFHDVFLPYEYPRDWVVEKRLAWAEQYLLQAFLAFNRSFEVLLAAYALARDGRLRGQPGAFWIRRVAADDGAAG